MNRRQISSLTCSPRHPSGWFSLRRPREQRPDLRFQVSCSKPQWLTYPTPTDRTEARATTSHFVPASTFAGGAHDDRANRGQSNALTCRARHDSGWRSPFRPREQAPEQPFQLASPPTQMLSEPPSEQRPEKRPQLSCPPPKWLARSTATKRTEARQRHQLSSPPPQWLQEPSLADIT